MKKRTLIILMSAVLVAGLAAGATLAYFTAADTATNTFTVGNVKIDLTEPGWTTGGGAADAPEAYPGEPLAKDPRVTNTGANPCVVRIKVELPAGVPGITFRNLDTTNWYYSDGYYYYLKPLGISETTTPLFTHVIMPTTLTNGDASTPYNIVVTAEAVQAQGIFTRYADMSDGINTTAAPANGSPIASSGTEMEIVKQMFTNAFSH